MTPWEDFPPKGLRLLGVDDAVVVVDGLRAAAVVGFGIRGTLVPPQGAWIERGLGLGTR